MSLNPYIISGGTYNDERGNLHFFNDFDMLCIKRMYLTTHYSKSVVRAWQGHVVEDRWFTCVKGAFIIKLIKIDDWENPSDSLDVLEFTLSEENPQVLYIPKGYVNGFQALEDHSKLMIMSNYKFNEIQNDQIRFDSQKWTTWQQ